ncbi:LOW QUALITY PROTEIN angiopoietin-1 [Prunus dulcis]|uniref:LOW QUALITY PROTEIN angiopoietin-1 n=1 Tax=Prunus dulcis TaxID=3755 RepID=A0A5E4GJ71_PRUDU|nr:LOW QUALITY PROTEIN angiopoietin-1 [Prunus dulcis]
MRDNKPLKGEKTRVAQTKVKTPVTKASAVIKVAHSIKVEKKEKNNQNMKERSSTGSRKKVRSHWRTPKVRRPKTYKELSGDDEEYADDEYLEELPEEVMEHLEKERKEEMAKFENELKVSKVKVKFGDFEEVNAMVVTLRLFFDARLNQPNYMDGDVFDEVESMVQHKPVDHRLGQN